MTGAYGGWESWGQLRYSITVTGLAPGEAVSLLATGTYRIDWVCGENREQCGDLGCAPAFSATTEGTAKATARLVAGSDGIVTAPIELVAAPPAESCPADPASPWGTATERWERLTIADSVHALVLTPDVVERVPIL